MTVEPEVLPLITDPEDYIWGHAISQYLAQGRHEELLPLIQALPIPDYAKQFLSDLTLGKVKRPRGRRELRSGLEERELMQQVFIEWDEQEAKNAPRPREEAIAAVASRYGMSEDELRGVYNKLQKQKFDRDLWKRYLFPQRQGRR